MEYKRSKALYLGILVGIAIVAGIAHQQPSGKLISVHVKDGNPNPSIWVAETNQSINQNHLADEEAEPNTALVID